MYARIHDAAVGPYLPTVALALQIQFGVFTSCGAISTRGKTVLVLLRLSLCLWMARPFVCLCLSCAGENDTQAGELFFAVCARENGTSKRRRVRRLEHTTGKPSQSHASSSLSLCSGLSAWSCNFLSKRHAKKKVNVAGRQEQQQQTTMRVITLFVDLCSCSRREQNPGRCTVLTGCGTSKRRRVRRWSIQLESPDKAKLPRRFLFAQVVGTVS